MWPQILENVPWCSLPTPARKRQATHDVVSVANCASFQWRILNCSGTYRLCLRLGLISRTTGIQILFPFSSSSLSTRRSGAAGESYILHRSADEKHVCGINKLLAGNSDRYAYYGEQVLWIHKLLRRTA